MTRKLTLSLILLLVLALTANATEVRIKDVAKFQGFMDNQLTGLGLVFGLNGTGDGNQSRFTPQAISNMLNSQGIRHDASAIRTKNVAMVIVTATLPPFTKPGQKIDVKVSSMGDAKSLQGGTLLLTKLTAANGQVYGTAQGQVVVGGFSAGGGGTSITQNVPTVGTVPGGAIVQRDVPINLQSRKALRLVLDNFDFTTATRVAKSVNARFGREIARSNDGGSIDILVPNDFHGKVIDFISEVEVLRVDTDNKAKVVINERTGTVVIGKDVKISTVAVAHGNLTISVSTQYMVSQPGPFSEGGETVIVPDEQLTVEEDNAEGEDNNTLMMLPEGTSIGEIVRALNALGVTPRDIVSILHALKAQGALQAELVSM